MSCKHYNKLVRDKIPAIIKKDGKKCIYKKIPKERFCFFLHKKLEEELEELEKAIEDNNRDAIIEEFADFFEVYGFIEDLGYRTPTATRHYLNALETVVKLEYNLNDIDNMILKKRKEKGSFKKRVYLDRVEIVT